MNACAALCVVVLCRSFFFFSSRRRHTRCSRDWSSDVCSSDLSSAERGLCRGDGAAGAVRRTISALLRRGGQVRGGGGGRGRLYKTRAPTVEPRNKTGEEGGKAAPFRGGGKPGHGCEKRDGSRKKNR